MYINHIKGNGKDFVFVSDSKGTAKTSVFIVEPYKILDAVLGICKTQAELIDLWFKSKPQITEITIENKPKCFYENSFDLRLFLEHLS